MPIFLGGVPGVSFTSILGYAELKHIHYESGKKGLRTVIEVPGKPAKGSPKQPVPVVAQQQQQLSATFSLFRLLVPQLALQLQSSLLLQASATQSP